MRPQASQPASVRKAIEGNLIERLPLTFQPFLNQEIRQWEFKFPYEQKYFECLVTFLENLPPDQFEELFRGVRQIESTMGIDRRQFSKEGQTMREASILTRSPHYLSWRQEINRVFEQINRSAFADEETRSANLNRLILLVFPSAIPVDPQRVAKRWAGSRLIRLDWGTDGAPRRPFLEMILKGSGADGKPGHGFLEEYAGKPGRSFADLWVLEPGTGLRNMLDGLRSAPEGPARAVLLSFDRLKPFREGVLENIKSMQRDISDADALYKRLRALDVSEWCPPEVRQVPAVREFIRALFLTVTDLHSSATPSWSGGRSRPWPMPAPLWWLRNSGCETSPNLLLAWRFLRIRKERHRNLLSPIPRAALWTLSCWHTISGWGRAVTRSTSAWRVSVCLRTHPTSW